MAEDSQQSRTEDATPRRLERAQQEGQVAYSSDLSSAMMLLITSLSIAIFSDYFLGSMTDSLSRFLASVGSVGRDDVDWNSMATQFINDFLAIVAPIAIVSVLSVLSVAGIMTGFKASPKALKLDFAKVHPAQGAKRLFSSRSVVRGLLAIGKLLALTLVVVVFVYWRRADFNVGTSSVELIVRTAWSISISLAITVSATLLIIGVIDLLFQKWKHAQDMKMSRQDVVDERKDDEGDPYMRARLRRLQREMGQRRMMDDVKTSTVVVTNPTHFAVAIKYDRDSMATPIVVAKGADHLAHKIIAIAKLNDVIILERKPLARALYHTASIGDEIPLEVFQAVAEVIAYVYQRNNAA